MYRVFLVAAVGTLSGAVGQILMRRGMQAVGPLESYAVLEVFSYFWRSLCNPYVVAGTVLSGILYFSILAALGWTGVTVAFPMTALEYGFGAVLAVILLKESVPPMRWIGIILVITGVIIIGFAGGIEDKSASTSSNRSGGAHSLQRGEKVERRS